MRPNSTCASFPHSQSTEPFPCVHQVAEIRVSGCFARLHSDGDDICKSQRLLARLASPRSLGRCPCCRLRHALLPVHGRCFHRPLHPTRSNHCVPLAYPPQSSYAHRYAFMLICSGTGQASRSPHRRLRFSVQHPSHSVNPKVAMNAHDVMDVLVRLEAGGRLTLLITRQANYSCWESSSRGVYPRASSRTSTLQLCALWVCCKG